MENRSVAFIDKHVILTMIMCMIVAISVFAFRYKNYEPYTPVEILIRDGKIMKGEIVRMTAETKKYSPEELVWDFGDKSMQKGTGNIVTHIYSSPGKYEVTLLIKDKNKEYKTLNITEEPAPPKPKPLTFICPSNVQVGKVASFKDTTTNAVSWEWKFGETGKVDATTRKANYTFKSPGQKTISLVINGSIQGETTVDVYEKAYTKDTTFRIVFPWIKEKPTEKPLPVP